MAKKSLIFIVMVVVSIVAILCLVGWTRNNQKNELAKRKVRIVIPQRQQEIRIVAVEEKLAPVKQEPKKKKKTDASKDKQPPLPKKNTVKAEKLKKLNPPKKMAAAQKPSPKKTQRKDVRPAKLFAANFWLNNRMIYEGRRLIDKKSSVPIVQASYERIGFEYYLKKMMDMGGRLFVGDAQEQKILAEVFVGYGSGKYKFFGLDERKRDELDGLALFRPREISGERLVNEILNYSWPFFKESDLRCVILLPLDKEAAILGALKEYLNKGGYDVSQFDVVWGNYFQAENQFGLRLERGRLSKTGEIVNLNMTLNM